jgi:hypothetical protein
MRTSIKHVVMSIVELNLLFKAEMFFYHSSSYELMINPILKIII